jgi:hypothetical protein
MVVYKLGQAIAPGTFTTRSVKLPSTNVTAHVTTTVGATPTVTVNLQGSMDNSNFVSIATATITTATVTKLVKPAAEFYEWFNIAFTANTNVTLAFVYIGGTEF